MQARKPSNAEQSSRKGVGSRVGTQPSNAHSQPVTAPLKEKDDSLISMIKQFLEKNGYTRTFQALKTEKPIKKNQPSYSGAKKTQGSNEEEKNILKFFDKGNRQQFFKNSSKIFSTTLINSCSEPQAHFLRKLEFELNIYFCIFSIHPCVIGASKKGHQPEKVDKSAAEAFKKYIETKGSEISDESELLVFYSLPYIPKPQENPVMARVFTKEWLQKLRGSLQEAIKEYMAKSSMNISNKQNKKSSTCILQEIYDQHLSMMDSKVKFSFSEKEEESTQQSKYQQEIIELKSHNKQMLNYLDVMQQNLKDLNEASKTNLVESNRKWFQFSKDILHLAKRSLRGEKDVAEKLEKYEKFFGLNIDELIYNSADISIFEKNSYFTEDISMVPGENRKANLPQMQKMQQPNQQINPIDVSKVFMLLNKADNKEYETQICLLLKALKDRLYFHKNAVLRREVIVYYQRNDICCVKPVNYSLQQKLLFEGGEKVREFYLRLMNHISTDNLGNQYLSESEKLIENLIGLMSTTSEDMVYRKHIFGILQRLSYIKQSQLTMISFGIIPIMFKIFRNEGEQLQFTSVQYLMGLIMNFAIKKESIVNFEKYKSEIFPILLKFIDVNDSQIKGYVNGTFYLLMKLEVIRREAIEKYHLKEIIENLLEKCEDEIEGQEPEEADEHANMVRQYRYILERLEKNEGGNLDETEDDYEDDDEDYYDDDIEEEMDMFSENDDSNFSEYIEGEENNIGGEELLMKKYALLGPEAVREELLTRSILDDTSRKSHNLTTSINHSKRIDKFFNKNENLTSVLGNKLDLSITPTR